MKETDHLIVTLHPNGVRELQLHRPQQRNAFDSALIQSLTLAIADAEQDPNTRLLLLSASGEYFCAGADIAWMKAAKDFTTEENIADAEKLGKLLEALYHFPKPTIAKVQGSAFGGAIGLICACDIAVGVIDAKLSFSEVRLGLVPAMISPYVVQAIGSRLAKKYFLTAEVFTASVAERMGLFTEVVPKNQLDQTIDELLHSLLLGGEKAQVVAKQLCLRQENGQRISTNVLANLLAIVRTSDEAQEGLSAFLDKRDPKWKK